MTAADKKQLISKVKAHVLRITYILFIISFFMPYATVTGCTSKKVTDFTGIDMIMHNEGLIYIVPVIIFIIFLTASFIKLKTDRSLSLQAFMFSWKAVLTGIAGIIIGVYPQLQFLFDEFEPRAGLFIAVFCCLAVYSYSMVKTVLLVRILKKGPGIKLTPGEGCSRLWYAANWIIIACGVAMVPYYIIMNIDSIEIAFILLFAMTLPFILSQIIVLTALVKNEPWSIRWSRAFSIIFVLFIVLMIYLHLS